MMKKSNLWVWGYTLDKIPSEMPFVDRPTHCSIETAADYLEAENIVYMDSSLDIGALHDNRFQYVSKYQNVLCGLTHGQYLESAEALSGFSLTHPNICGAIIDDFYDGIGPSRNMTVAELKTIQRELKSRNPALKLFVVRYDHQDQNVILPYADFFDGICYWIWVSTEHAWSASYHPDILKMKRLFNKPILQGTFIHNYGEDYGDPIPMDKLQLQCRKISEEIQRKNIDGWVILQNGWFCRHDHREQIQWLKNYLDWFYGTTTFR